MIAYVLRQTYLNYKKESVKGRGVRQLFCSRAPMMLRRFSVYVYGNPTPQTLIYYTRPRVTCTELPVIVWLQKGTKAPQAAGRIHSDFEKGFIMAEVMKFDDFKEAGSENACKVNICCVVLCLGVWLSYHGDTYADRVIADRELFTRASVVIHVSNFHILLTGCWKVYTERQRVCGAGWWHHLFQIQYGWSEKVIMLKIYWCENPQLY